MNMYVKLKDNISGNISGNLNQIFENLKKQFVNKNYVSQYFRCHNTYS